MDYEPLHHKYRPQTFGQLVGQSAIATTLSNALQQNRIAPAYLFCGPRGTGKTSSARILAKSLNCLNNNSPSPEPCGQCQVCQEIANGAALDIVEIDAASNTGVDNIRELIERAQFAPVQCRYKLYVLDEVHMLSTAAFNALLKTLEEPPDRVVFVLATTDPQRVLPTIISRCQRFDFRRIPLGDMVHHLNHIAEAESISVTADALQLVAQISQGGLRDAESLLDQLGLLEGTVTLERVWDLVGAVPERDLLTLVQAIATDDSPQLLEQARHLMDRGREPLIILQGLVGFYRDLLIAKTASQRQDLVAVTPSTWAEMITFAQALSVPLLLASQQHLRSAEVQVKNTTQPRLWLEITLMGLLPSSLGVTNQPSTISTAPSATAPSAIATAPAKQAPSSVQTAAPPPSSQPASPNPTAAAPSATPQPAPDTSQVTPQTAPQDDPPPASQPDNEAPPAPPAPPPPPAQGSNKNNW
ncbi:MAG: DNA polymerase III subunit gamma/tau, partial [Cyanobacteria bacterium P01_F01_bin.4]